MEQVIPSSGKAAASILIGLLGSVGSAAAQSNRGGMDDVFSFGFDRCLEILRTQDPGDALRANRQQRPNAPCILAEISETNAAIMICDDARLDPRSPTIQSRTVRATGILDFSARLELSRWAEQMQTGFADFAGVAELPPPRDSTVPRYSWCEDGDQPFFVGFGGELPGHPIYASIYTFGAADDPNPCEQE